MRAGIETAVATMSIIVTDEMTARLDERPLHPVYSTFWLGYHAECAARRAIEPYFEEHENAVGAALSIRHLAMAGVGAEVSITARVTEVKGRKIVCSIEARCKDTVLADGSQTQIVLTHDEVREKVDRAVR
jgi:predicted thioesterase